VKKKKSPKACNATIKIHVERKGKSIEEGISFTIWIMAVKTRFTHCIIFSTGSLALRACIRQAWDHGM